MVILNSSISWLITPISNLIFFVSRLSITNFPLKELNTINTKGSTAVTVATTASRMAIAQLILLFIILFMSLKSAAILSMVGSLKYFDLIYVMTGGGPGTATELMATYMYKNSFVQFNMGYGSAVAAGMFILITGLSLVTMRVINGKKEV